MKRIVAGTGRKQLLATLDTILRHWGYRVLASSQPRQVRDLAREVDPDLLILDAQYLHSTETCLDRDIANRIGAGRLPLLVLGNGEESPDLCALPHQRLDTPLDIFALFELTQQHLQTIPRKNLRLKTHLPSLVYSGVISTISEVLSLSMQGMFVKTSVRIPAGEPIRVMLPLIGMKTELDIAGRVLYLVDPGRENAYMQGVGIEFTEMDEQAMKALAEFLERRLIGEITGDDRPHLEFDREQLKTRRQHRDSPGDT